MKLKKSIASVMMAIVFALMLPMSGCQRLARSTGKEIDPRQGEEVGTRPKPLADPGEEDVGYLIPLSINEGFTTLYGYCDSQGNLIIDYQFEKAQPFYECGLAVVSDSNFKYGLIDKTGKYVVEPSFSYIEYSEGVFVCGSFYKGYGSKVYDSIGQMLFESDRNVTPFSEGLAYIYEKGYVDKKGNLVISLPDYKRLSHFRNGIALVGKDYGGPTYYIDKQGRDVTDMVSSGLRMFKDEETKCFGFMNAQGEVIIPPQFAGAEPFLNGYAIVKPKTDQWYEGYGVIDTQGRYVLEPIYCGIWRLSNGLVAVGEAFSPDDYRPMDYFEYAKKALFTSDFSYQTDWIFPTTEDFDENVVCVNDEDSVYFMDAQLNPAEHLPTFKGNGSFKADGELLRGLYNGLMTVADRNGRILARSGEWMDLGGGLKAQRLVKTPNKLISIEYPVLSGLGDKAFEDALNQLIYEAMLIPGDEDIQDTDEYDGLSLNERIFSLNRVKDLILIDQTDYGYMLGAAHGMFARYTAYVDLKKAVVYTLDDLFKKDKDVYAYLSDVVTAQMLERKEMEGFWADEMTITPTTPFAITEEGLVLYFWLYEIGPYSAGLPEFPIPYADLMDYIDTEGDFWKAFH